jgi:hypothetical protein
MSSKTKKASTRGVRYDAAKQQEVVDFVTDYNAGNGRGGQAAAAKKFGITQLTIAGWLKRSGKPAVKKAAAKKAIKAAKVAKAVKAVKTVKTGGKGRGRRYSDSERKAVIDFVLNHNQANGRGGQAAAVKKFGLTALTVAGWLKAVGAPKPGKKTVSSKGATAAKAAKKGMSAAISSNATTLVAKVGTLLDLADRIRGLENQLEVLRSEYDKQRSALRSAL